jgi:hypothetical protein
MLKYIECIDIKGANKHDPKEIFKVKMEYKTNKNLLGVIRDDLNPAKKKQFAIKYPVYESSISSDNEYKLFRYEFPTARVVNLKRVIIKSNEMKYIKSVWYNWPDGEFGFVPASEMDLSDNAGFATVLKSDCIIDLSTIKYGGVTVHLYADPKMKSPIEVLYDEVIDPTRAINYDEKRTENAIIKKLDFVYDKENDLIIDDGLTIGYAREYKYDVDVVHPLENLNADNPGNLACFRGDPVKLCVDETILDEPTVEEHNPDEHMVDSHKKFVEALTTVELKNNPGNSINDDNLLKTYFK